MNTDAQNIRLPIDDSQAKATRDMTYGDYLNLGSILTSQQPVSSQHDEMLFIIFHQASELWLKLIGHELIAAKVSIGDADLRSASKAATRINQILVQMVQSWNIFSTLSPVAYLEFRDELGSASGYQSYGYRKIEFLLGNKNAKLLHAYNTTPDVLEDLTEVLHAPSLYDEVIRQLHHSGFSIDPSSLDRDFSKPYESNDAVMKAWLQIYRNVDTHSEFYDLAERLVDIEDTFQQWRFKHMYTVQRIIGHRRGTGGSSGVPFLKKALDTCFFPELIELRTEL